MTRSITEHDEGKRVVDGEIVGIVSAVRNGTAYVDPDPGITGTIRSKLGWESVDDEDYPLRHTRIDAVTDDEIRLTRNL